MQEKNEGVEGIEPSRKPWQGLRLPLQYTPEVGKVSTTPAINVSQVQSAQTFERDLITAQLTDIIIYSNILKVNGRRGNRTLNLLIMSQAT